MGAFQPIHLIIILVIVVLLFGGSKIPELMRGVGKGMGEFKKGVREGHEDVPATDELAQLRAKQAELEAEKQRLAEKEAELKAKSGGIS